MKIERDVRIEMDDGIVLRADIFRPDSSEKIPVIMTYGPYGKGVRYEEGYKSNWNWMINKHGETLKTSEGQYMTWETVDPELWIPFGYAVIRVDSRGAGRSEGVLDIFSPRETRDLYQCIEWAGNLTWSNGKVGLCGISYHAINQWFVASERPPHLTAMVAWEGAADHYRDMTHHGGILANNFFEQWFRHQVLPVQHGKGVNGYMDPWLNQPASGPETLSEDELSKRREDYIEQIRTHSLVDQYHLDRTAKFEKIDVPFISAANWGGFGLHQRGNFEGFVNSSSRNKWLEVHFGRHEEAFYLDYAVEMQKNFFDRYLKSIENGFEKTPPVMLWIRHIDRFVQRFENEWPLKRTKWTKYYLDLKHVSMSENGGQTGEITFYALGEGLTFLSRPMERDTEITGPLAAKLFASSSTKDADFFLTLRAFNPMLEEIDFFGTMDPHTPLAQGWLRASHRRLDAEKSKEYRPYHSHTEVEPLIPGKMVELYVEIWPTCIVLPTGYYLGLTIQGKDFQRSHGEGEYAGGLLRGSGPFLHTDPVDRPKSVFGGKTTLHSDEQHKPYLLVPIIP